MRKTLENLYYGNISPSEQQYARNTKYDKAIRTVSEKEEQLKILLCEKEREMLKKMVTAQITLNGITAEENLILGFRLGMRLGIEIMDDTDSGIITI